MARDGRAIAMKVPVCPHCTSAEFRGVGVRNSIEKAFLWLLQLYRCSLCGHHFFLFRWRAHVDGTA